MRKRKLIFLALVVSIVLLLTPSVFAHGVEISHQWSGDKIVITCRYDDGSPMTGAAIDIFAPNDPANPLIIGQTDNSGSFSFVPNRTQTGVWGVRARLDGHGTMEYITIEKARLFSAETMLQSLLGIAVLVFLAAAIHFFRKSAPNK
jgi:nickel transport protein